MDYKYDEESVQTLVQWAQKVQLPEKIDFSKFEEISDISQYVRANINDIQSLYPNVYCYGAITRLYLLKELLEQ